MRSILGLVLLMAPRLAAPAERPAEARVDLLTYGEMMQLAPEARLTYVHDFGRLLALMEKQFEAKYDGASVADVRERRGQVAALMRMLGVSEAEAAEAANAPAPKGGAAPAASAGVAAPPAAKEFTPAPPEGGATGPWADPPTKIPGGEPPYQVPKVSRVMPPELKASCEAKPPTCAPLSPAERKKLLLDFRKGPDTNCVAGAFFTKKKEIGGRAGSCEIVRSLKFGNKTVDCNDSSSGKSGGNDAMCNPFPFCIKYPDVQVTKNKKVVTIDIPIAFCVKSGQDITERCMEKYNQILKTGKDQRTLNEFKKSNPKIAGQLKQTKACDGTFKGVDSPVADVYRDLREKTITSYKEHCLSTKGYFGQLFCKECGRVYDQIHTMLANAGHACGAATEPGPYPAPDRNYQMPGSTAPAESSR